jgi:large subunit ribosomal protein L35Ae
MSQPIYGRIVNYRIGIRTQASRECLIQFSNIISSAQAGQLVGKRVVWKDGKEDFVGRIVGFHGKNGAVRVRFRKGVPGQALGAIVELVN